MSWTIALRRDSDFWEDTLEVTDEAGAPVTFTNVTLIITPDQEDEPEVTWTLGSQISMPSAGVINFLVLKAVIAAYTWTTGKYRLEVIYPNTRIDGSFLTGSVRIQ